MIFMNVFNHIQRCTAHNLCVYVFVCVLLDHLSISSTVTMYVKRNTMLNEVIPLCLLYNRRSTISVPEQIPVLINAPISSLRINQVKEFTTVSVNKNIKMSCKSNANTVSLHPVMQNQ